MSTLNQPGAYRPDCYLVLPNGQQISFSQKHDPAAIHLIDSWIGEERGVVRARIRTLRSAYLYRPRSADPYVIMAHSQKIDRAQRDLRLSLGDLRHLQQIKTDWQLGFRKRIFRISLRQDYERTRL